MQPTHDLHRVLRLEVGRFRQRESRRVFDLVVQVGTLGGSRDSFVARAQDLPALDHALRVDVVSALLETGEPDWRDAWILRPGLPEPHDLDAAWHAAARAAFAIHGRTLDGFFVLTRTGWRDVRSGERRTWKRLRL